MKLAKCLFCGSKDVEFADQEFSDQVVCNDCWAQGPYLDKGGTKWNAAARNSPITILFNSDKEVGDLKAFDGNHGIHIANNPDALLEQKGDPKYGGKVPNEHTVAMLKFASPDSIDEVIKWLSKSKEFFKKKQETQP